MTVIFGMQFEDENFMFHHEFPDFGKWQLRQKCWLFFVFSEKLSVILGFATTRFDNFVLGCFFPEKRAFRLFCVYFGIVWTKTQVFRVFWVQRGCWFFMHVFFLETSVFHWRISKLANPFSFPFIRMLFLALFRPKAEIKRVNPRQIFVPVKTCAFFLSFVFSWMPLFKTHSSHFLA